VTIILGIDVGGTGIKGAPVNLETGELSEERFRVLTPQPATPEAVAVAVAEVDSPLS
jgi:polyphosphate glucokinase